MADYTLMIAYAVLALGASFLCSILEAVLLSTSHGHIVALKDTHAKVSATWSKWKEDPEGPLTAILTLNTIAHTVGALGVGSCLLYTSPSPRDATLSRMPSSA